MSREIRIPFKVGPSGAIDFTVDPVEQAVQHIQSAVLTNPGERVMRPGYGVATVGALFESDDPSIMAGLQADMRMKIHSYVPEVEITGVELRDASPDDGLVAFYISFRLVGSDETHEADIKVGGTVIERTFPG